MPYSKTANTFRFCDAAQRAAARAGLGSPTFRDDFATPAKRNRFVGKLSAERRPRCIRDGLSHRRRHQFLGVHISDVNLREPTSNLRRRNVQEMSALVGYLNGQSASAGLLASLLKYRQPALIGAVVPLRGDLLAGRESGKVFQAKVDAYSVARALIGFRQLDLNIDVPAASRVGRKLPRLRLAAFGHRTRLPQAIGTAKYGQPAIIELRRSREIAEWDEIEALLVGAESRCLRKTSVARVGEFATDGVDGVRMDAKFFRHPPAEICEVKGRRPASNATRFPSRRCLTVDLTTIVPDKVHGPRLSPKGIARSAGCVFDAISEGEYQKAGLRSVAAEPRSRTHSTLLRRVGSSFLPLKIYENNS